MNALRVIAAALLAVASAAALVEGSALSWPDADADTGWIRLSWRAVGRRVEACREPSAEELAALPVHMRQQTLCEARLTPFQLSVEIDGEPVAERRIEPSGIREDRPAYVDEEFRVAPGEHRLRVRFATELPEGMEPEPPELLEATVRVETGRILLVTRGEGGLALAAD